MLRASDFCRELSRFGSDFYTGVPDSLLKELCAFLNARPPGCRHIQAVNEGGAVALAAGSCLATGRIPVVYMQNSGLGNSVNPLLSLADPEVYGIPMLLLIGWRGEPAARDEPQHVKQGRITLPLLDAMNIPFGIIGPDWIETAAQIEKAYHTINRSPGPYALVVRKGCFEKEGRRPAVDIPGDAITRRDAIRAFVEQAPPATAFVATTGLAGRELFDLRKERGESHARDFLNVGAMGHASMIALGVALSRPERRVVCLDGDGAFLMHMGAATIVAGESPPNYTHVLLNNGTHDSVGGQPNQASRIDLAEVASACGYRRIFRAARNDEMAAVAAAAVSAAGPVFVAIRLAGGTRSEPGRPPDSIVKTAREFHGFLNTGPE